MYRSILAAVTILSFSHISLAADKAEVLKCVDTQNMQFNQTCVSKTFEKHANSQSFFNNLSTKSYPLKRDALASISLHPDKKLIEIKTYKLDFPAEQLLAAK